MKKKKDSFRIYSSIYDTADQDRQLEKYRKNSEDDEAKKALSNFGLIQLKLQALFLGKIIIPDSTFYNNFCFHPMSNSEFNDFKKFLIDSGNVELRARSKDGLVKDIFSKAFNIRGYWSQKLQEGIYNAGEYFRINKRVINGETADDYIIALEHEFPDITKVPDYYTFRDNLIRMDETAKALNENGNLFLWRTPLGETTPDEDKDTKEFETVVANKRNDLISEVNNWVCDDSYKNKIITELNKDFPNGSVVENICLRDIKSDIAEEFFFNKYHHGMFCQGMARQHYCNKVEILDDNNSRKTDFRPSIKVDIKAIEEIDWQTISDFCQKDSKSMTLRNSLVNEFGKINPNEDEIRRIGIKIKRDIGIAAESDVTTFIRKNNVDGNNPDGIDSLTYQVSRLENGKEICITFGKETDDDD